jgi:hypothetical protein
MPLPQLAAHSARAWHSIDARTRAQQELVPYDGDLSIRLDA